MWVSADITNCARFNVSKDNKSILTTNTHIFPIGLIEFQN